MLFPMAILSMDQESDRHFLERLYLNYRTLMFRKALSILRDPYDVEENLHLLIDQSFLTVVDSEGHFTGIVTRRELLKAVNYTVHRFDHFYNVSEKD